MYTNPLRYPYSPTPTPTAANVSHPCRRPQSLTPFPVLLSAAVQHPLPILIHLIISSTQHPTKSTSKHHRSIGKMAHPKIWRDECRQISREHRKGHCWVSAAASVNLEHTLILPSFSSPPGQDLSRPAQNRNRLLSPLRVHESPRNHQPPPAFRNRGPLPAPKQVCRGWDRRARLGQQPRRALAIGDHDAYHAKHHHRRGGRRQ